uniref:Phenylacetic acid catabolic protein n=1 Tax=Malikia spinosa TaxID=86180 RepID=UPI003FA27005
MSATANYLLHLADNAVVLGQRNAEWCGHGPALEEDIALANVSLDLIGQARLLYQQAAAGVGGGAPPGRPGHFPRGAGVRHHTAPG